MGADYSAHAIIGVRIPVERLHRVERVRVCTHIVPTDAEYCPRCGKPVHQLQSKPIYGDFHDLLGGLKVVFGTDQAFAVVGLVHCEARYDSEPVSAELPTDLSDVRSVIEGALRRYELWEGQTIALYSILNCSY